jgi:taurine dioxygenase
MSAVVHAKPDGTVGRFSWKLKQPFGVEVEGDVSQPLTETERATLAALFYANGFLAFRNQQLDKSQFRAFNGSLAPPLPEAHEANPVLAVDPEIGGFGRTELIFHRDLSYAEHPFQAIALHALDVVPGETSTYIASCTRAYRLLPEDLKSQLEHLQIITALGTDATARIQESEKVMSPGWPRYVHKLVSPHPVTGEPVLLVCPMSSVRIESMSREESEALLQKLFGYVTDAANVSEHTWQNGDLLIWDNFGTLHARKKLEGIQKRTLQRQTLGKLSFPQAFPNFSMRKHTDTYQKSDYMGKNSGGRF